LGGVWISLYPKKKHQKYAREVLDIPSHVGVLCILAIGQPAEKKKARTKYNAGHVHHDEW
jgi:nitroreductase